MNKYVKEFFHRGLIFSGFGPVVAGIVYLILSKTIKDFSLTGFEVFLAIITTYLIAFIHAGISVITTYDKLNKLQQSVIQGIVLYTTYLTGYLLNSWLPLDLKVILIFSSCFIFGFILIWVIVYLSTKKLTDKMNKSLENIDLNNEV